MGKGSKAPAGYQPSGQPQADQGYQSLVAGATPYANQIASTTVPGLTNAANAVGNNPYFNQAMYGAQFGDAAAQSRVVPGQLQASDRLHGLGNGAANFAPYATAGAGLAQGNYDSLVGAGNYGLGIGQQALAAGTNTYNQAHQLIPGTTGGAGIAPGITLDGLLKAQQQYGTAMQAIPGLTGGMDAASQVLNTGFDPQNALHDRGYQQTMEHQNALNSMYGLGTSAAGAGLAGDASRNYNMDWQNQQLQRQISALGAYGTQQGRVADNLTSLLGSATNNYGSLTNAAVGNYNSLNAGTANNFAALANSGTAGMSAGTTAANQSIDNYRQSLTQAAQNYQTLMGGAVDNYGNLVNAAHTAYGGAGTQGTQGIQLAAAAAAAPGQTYMQQQQAYINALQALAGGGTQALAPTQNLIHDQGDYLNIGQGATRNAQNATSINNANQAAQMGGIGGLVGKVAGIALGAATGGLSLFGLGGAAGAFQGGGAAGGFMSGVGNLLHNDPTGMWSLGKAGG